jgi:hypothetical protein
MLHDLSQFTVTSNIEDKQTSGGNCLMEISFVLNAEDLVAFQKHFVCHRPEGRRIRIQRWLVIVGFSLLLIFLVVLSHAVTQEQDQPHWRFGTVLIPGVGFLIFAALFRGRVQAWEIRRNAQKGLYGKVLGTHHVTLTPEAFVARTETSTNSSQWSGIEEIASTPTHAFIYTGPATAHIVPRRAFESDQTFRNFVETAKQFREAAAGEQCATQSADWQVKAANLQQPRGADERIQLKNKPPSPNAK